MPREFDGADLERASLINTTHQIASSLLVRMENSGNEIGAKIRSGIRSAARLVRSVKPLPVDARPVGNRKFAKGQENLAISALTLHIARNLDATEIVERRRRNYYALMARVRDLSTPMVHELASGVSPLFYPFWCENKREVHALLNEAGIEAIDFWSEGSPLVAPGQFPEVEALRRHVLELPIHQDLETSDIDALAKAMHQALGADEQA